MTARVADANESRLPADPSLRPSQAGRAANLVPTHLWVNVALDDLAIESDLRPTGWEEATVHPDIPPRSGPDRGRQHVGLDEVVPGEGDDVFVTFDTLGPEGVGIPGLDEFRLNHRRLLVGELRKENCFYGGLEVAGHGDVVRVDTDLVVNQVALEEQYVTRSTGRIQDAPVADPSRLGSAFFSGQTDERVFSG